MVSLKFCLINVFKNFLSVYMFIALRCLSHEYILLDLLDLSVLLSHCVAFMTDLNVGQIISNTNSLVLVQDYQLLYT